MSSCISGGGGRTYGFDFDLLKSPSTSSRTSHTSSPSSTLSESSNSQLAISTRKPRTPRKRPNQTYNEAAALLSTAYPNIFSTKNLTKPCKFTKQKDGILDESAELLLPFRVVPNSSSFLLHEPILEKPIFPFEPKAANLQEKPCQSPGEISSRVNSLELGNDCEVQDFDAESILDEEIIEEGIDSIMGKRVDSSNIEACYSEPKNGSLNWNAMGLGFSGERFDFGFGLRRGGVRAMRHVDEGNWWCFPTVDVLEISPKYKPPAPAPAEKNNKKKKKVEKPAAEWKNTQLPNQEQSSNPVLKSTPGSNLLLKLNYDDVLKAWSDRGSPFSEEMSGADVSARLAQIDLFSENGGGLREVSVLRYKEKRRTRLFSKKIRYQVRKVNADQRPRMKGRFVRRPNSSKAVK